MKKQFLSLSLLIGSAGQLASAQSLHLSSPVSLLESEESHQEETHNEVSPSKLVIQVHQSNSNHPNRQLRKNFYRRLKNAEQRLQQEIAQREGEDRNTMWPKLKLKSIALLSNLYSKAFSNDIQETETEVTANQHSL